jgi:hypothetical protein
VRILTCGLQQQSGPDKQGQAALRCEQACLPTRLTCSCTVSAYFASRKPAVYLRA